MSKRPVLYIVIPCYNEEEVLPVTLPLFTGKLQELIDKEKISTESKIMFVNDGSKDKTWDIICKAAEENPFVCGICQSRNRGHQNAVLAGMMEAKNRCNITITIDCDGQDDINAMNDMVDEYLDGAEIVYGVRSNRTKDSFLKRFTAESYYRFMKVMGVEIIFNHADYRLVSSRALEAFSDFKEVNIFLRGMFPMVGFKSTCVYYERQERMEGKSHYTISKMLHLALDGITSLSTKPLQIISTIGVFISLLSFIGVIWAVVMNLTNNAVSGWASIICIVCFMSGIQLISIGILGEYIGKIYMESKHRPRYIISEKTYDDAKNHSKKEENISVKSGR